MKKRIFVVCQHYWPENFRITDFCEGLIERGYEVDVLCGIPNYPQGEFYDGYSYIKKRKEIHNGVRIFRTFEIPRKGNTNLMIFLNYISFPIASLFHIPKFLFKKYDKVFIYELSPVLMGIAGILISKIKRIESTLYVLDLWPENLYSVLTIKNQFARKFLMWVSNWFYRNSDKLICISPEMETLLKKRIGKSDKKITTVYQYCEKLYEEQVLDKNLKKRFEKYFTIVFTGNVTPAQSPETIIKTAILLKQNGYSKKIHFVIVGGGMSKDQLIADIKKNNLTEMFDFEGIKPVESMPSYYNIADVLLATLRKSSLLKLTVPAKITSYIASGKPIIASMEGAGERLINEIGCGFVSKPEDKELLYKNIIKIYQMKPKDRQRLGDRARKYHFANLERNLSIDKIIQFMFD